MVNHLSDEQRAVNAIGVARCREVVTTALAGRVAPEEEPQLPPTPSELIHQRALERAITERRNTRLSLTIGATA
jgi:hypothetical protein